MTIVLLWRPIFRDTRSAYEPANTTDGNGRFIFAGYKTESAPFDSVTGEYRGGAEAITQQVDTARNMAISHTGQQIFESITSNAEQLPGGGYGETNMFKILDSAVAALKTPIENDQAAAAVQNR